MMLFSFTKDEAHVSSSCADVNDKVNISNIVNHNFNSILVNDYLSSLLCNVHNDISMKYNNQFICDVNTASMQGGNSTVEFKIELNSHTNMPVVGKGAHIEYIGRTADVNAFSPNIATSRLPIVDAVVQYDCAHSG